VVIFLKEELPQFFIVCGACGGVKKKKHILKQKDNKERIEF